MITHRNAWMNTVGTLLHMPMTPGRPLPLDAADVPRQRLDLHLDGDRGRRHARLPARRSIRRRSSSSSRSERVTLLCAAPTVLIALANAPAEAARRSAPRGVQRGDGRRAAGGGHHRAAGRRARLGGHAGLRADRDVAVHHRSASRAPSTRRCRRPSARVDQGAAGRRADHLGRAARGRRSGGEVPARRRRRSARSSCAATS